MLLAGGTMGGEEGFRRGLATHLVAEGELVIVDIAASSFGNNGRYRLALEDRELDSDGLIELLGRWIDRYQIVSVEDPVGEDDAEGFRRFTQAFGGPCKWWATIFW